jgi:hypothetical protein
MPKRYKSDLDACKPGQLLSLLQLASKQETPETATRTGAAGNPRLGKKLRELCARSGHDGPDLLEQAAHPESSVEQLREVMLTAKTLSAEAADEEQWYAASFLYQLAVAAAFARHQVNLSGRSPGSRISLYEDFAASLLEDPLGEIFRAAADRARSGS